MPKNFIGQPFRVSLKSGIEKLYASEGYVTFSVEVFLSHNGEKFCRGTLPCCVSETFWKRKSLWIRGRGKCPDSPSIFSGLTMPKKFVGQPFRVSLNSGIEKLYASEGYVTISVEVFLSDNAEKFCRGTLLCCVSEKFRQQKSLRIRGREKCPDSPMKISCLTVPKKFVGQPFRMSLISGIEKFYASEGYVTISIEIFRLTVPKNAVGEPFSHSLILGTENVWIRGRGSVEILRRKFLVLLYRKTSSGNPLGCH